MMRALKNTTNLNVGMYGDIHPSSRRFSVGR